MTREQAIDQAVHAAHKAEILAGRAEEAARGTGPGSAPSHAAAGRTWAETSRAYTALAALLTEEI
ncbi:hypothetical protein QA942_10325 [Streptomyces sp. B21-106]|uniref:hypothetical protein n=1 Tax=Streptomyces sp. B21-106 TaxID=3039418 RepID=UPI002FF19609